MKNEEIEKVLTYLNSLTASIVYEDPYDYSAGIKGAEVDYRPDTIEELAVELGVTINGTPLQSTEVMKKL